MKVTLIALLLLIQLASTLQNISNDIPQISKITSTTQLQEEEIYRGQHFSYKFPISTGYYSNRISNQAELKQQNVHCQWEEELYNYSNVATTKDFNLSEGQKLIAAGAITNNSTYYILSNMNRLFEVQTEISTGSLKSVRNDVISQNVQSNTEMWRYNNNSLVFKSNNTLIFIKESGLSYVSLTISDAIIKILPVNDSIYLISQKKLRRWKTGIVEDIDLGENVQNLIDIDVDLNNNIYILDSRRGIYIFDGSSYKQYSFNSSEGYFSKLRVINKTIQCVYTLQKANYLVELYQLADKLSINKIYPVNAHINDIIAFNHYAVLIHDYHLTLLQHSANRQIPQLTYNEIISSILIVGVTKIVKLFGGMVLILTDQSAFLSKQIEVKPPELVCDFQNPGTYKISMQYELPSCEITETQIANDPVHQFCLRQFSKTLVVKEGRRRGTVVFAYILFGIMILTGLGVLVLGIMYCGKQIRKKEELVNSMREKRVKTQATLPVSSELNDTNANNGTGMNVTNANATGINTTMQPMQLGRR